MTMKILGNFVLGTMIGMVACCGGDSAGADYGTLTAGATDGGGSWTDSASATATTAGTSGGGTGGSGGGWGSTGGEPPPPPEEEEDADFRIPRPSGRFVYSASELTHRVAVIDSNTLTIDVVDVGLSPTVVAAIPGTPSDSGAVAVLCPGEDAVALLRTTSAGITTVELRPTIGGANNLAVSPDGAFVFVYHDVDHPDTLGAGSTQDLTVVATTAGGSQWSMAVGANPRDVGFSLDGGTAWVVTDDGVNPIPLDEIEMLGKPDLIPVVTDPAIDPSTLEIRLAPSKDQVLARREGEQWLVVTDLVTRQQRELDLPWIPTDLDIAADGSFAILVLPHEYGSDLVEVPLPVTTMPGYTVTSLAPQYVGLANIAPDGQSLLLYTTQNPWMPSTGTPGGVVAPGEPFEASGSSGSGSSTSTGSSSSGSSGSSGGSSTGGNEPPPPDWDPRERLTVAHRVQGSWGNIVTQFVEIPITSVGMAPDSRNAILLHEKSPQLNAVAPWPYTLVDFSKTPLPIKKRQMTAAKPGPIIYTPSTGVAALLLRDDARSVRAVDLADLESFIVTPITLGSPPVGGGYVEATDKLFIAQEHASGRITFIGGDGTTQTVTGFELNDAVKD
jgi:uncharacterized membrane protein YgcG